MNISTTLKYSGDIFYPPFSDKATISPDNLVHYESNGSYLAHKTFNGTRTIIEFSPDKINLWTRDKKIHKNLNLCKSLMEQLNQWHECLGRESAHVIDGEMLLDKNLKKRFIAFDILVFDNEHLIGSNILERYELLTKLMGPPDDYEKVFGNNLALEFTNYLWLAESYLFNFSNEYKRHEHVSEVQGLVLKSLKDKLKHEDKEKNNENLCIHFGPNVGFEENREII